MVVEVGPSETSKRRRELVYDDGCVQVWNGDARELPLADGTVHLVITSPPYNCRVAYDGYHDWLPWDQYWHDLIEPSMRECFRVLAPGGRLAVNLANVIRQDVLPNQLNLSADRRGLGGRPARTAKRGL